MAIEREFAIPVVQAGIGLIVEVFDVDDASNHTVHDSIDFYGRTLLDLNLYPSKELAKPHRLHLHSLFGTYTNLTADFSVELIALQPLSTRSASSF